LNISDIFTLGALPLINNSCAFGHIRSCLVPLAHACAVMVETKKVLITMDHAVIKFKTSTML
jgi:hypothetical protein